jgi:hypothetical protein
MPEYMPPQPNTKQSMLAQLLQALFGGHAQRDFQSTPSLIRTQYQLPEGPEQPGETPEPVPPEPPAAAPPGLPGHKPAPPSLQEVLAPPGLPGRKPAVPEQATTTSVAEALNRAVRNGEAIHQGTSTADMAALARRYGFTGQYR